jgi:autotransporter-associated beta strand protein
LKNAANTVGLEKFGTGTWTLSGSGHSYTGTTTIYAGKIVLSGSLASSITASAGSLAPQGSASTSGGLDIQSGGRFETSLSAFSVGGNVTLAGALDVIANPGLPAGNTLIILNKTSVGAISGTFAGKPQDGTFVASGYNWIINYTGGDGNDVTLKIATALEQWRLLHFGNTANNDHTDTNNDGETNLLEYATGQNPYSQTRNTTSIVKNGNVLEFTYVKNKTASDLTYQVAWSDNLTSWSSAGVTSQVISDNGTIQTIKASLPAGTNTRRFVRLTVSAP